jgi:hypothetical protein
MRNEIILALIIVLITGFASGSFIKGNNSFLEKTAFGKGETITGMINISFVNQSINSSIRSSFGGDISLGEFLELNDAGKCSNSNCEDEYAYSGSATSKTFSLAYNGKKFIGFLITGNLQEQSITSMEFNISSNAEKSCNVPLKIDLPNDGNEDFVFAESSDDFSCSKNKGCYSDSSQNSETEITNTPYCEKMFLDISPAVKIGAWVKGSGEGLSMGLYDNSGELAGCDIPKESISANGGEVSCIAEDTEGKFPIEERGYYYVCVSSEFENSGYNTKIRTGSNACGFFSEPPYSRNYTSDYYLFASSGKYKAIKPVRISLDESQLADLNYYIEDKYNWDCNSGCLIPAGFYSGTEQDISVSNVKISFRDVNGPKNSDKVYDVSAIPAKISSSMQMLDIGIANFTAPQSYGNFTFAVYLDDFTLFYKNLIIERVPIITKLTPLNPPAAAEITFVASAYSPRNSSILSYLWDFGDGGNEITSKNEVTHVYDDIGEYELKVSAIDSGKLIGSRSFNIIVGNPEKAANYTLQLYKKRLANISTIIGSMPEWQSDKLLENFNLSDYQYELKNIEQDYNLASTEEEYVSIMSSLTEADFPQFIKKSSKTSFPFVTDLKNIDPSYIGALGKYNSGNDEEYKKAISSWMRENMKGTIGYDTYSAEYKDRKDDVLYVYRINIDSVDLRNYKSAWIVFNINKGDLSFKEDYNEKVLGDGSGIEIENPISIEFSTYASPETLDIYLSPELVKLPLITEINECNFNKICEEDESWQTCRSDCKPWGLAGILIGIIILIAVIGYFILGWWYQRKYENYLFKDRNDLFNLINFANNAFIQGLNEGQITKDLKEKKWNAEQIAYILKKVKGKNTGMPGIQMSKLRSEFKKTGK